MGGAGKIDGEPEEFPVSLKLCFCHFLRSEREALVSDVQLMEVDVFSPEHHNRLEDQRGIAPLSATPVAQNNF